MMIKCGILCIPDWDEGAIAQLRLLLREHLPTFIIADEKSALCQRHWVEEILRQWADEDELSLILTIGGTYPAPGPSNAEIVPEATDAVLERRLPGISEAMRAYGQVQTDLALLDRGVAGIRSRSVIVNLPAGAAAAHLFFESVVTLLPAILAHLHDDPHAPRMEDDLEIVVDENTKVTSQSEGAAKPTDTDGAIPNQKAGSSLGKKALDPAEFAEFLQRKK